VSEPFSREISGMEVDTDKIDDAVLALLWLTVHDGRRAWKGLDREALGRLHRKGLIADPANKAKSVVLSDEGLERAEALFKSLFMRPK
jgi:hypothetical protein